MITDKWEGCYDLSWQDNIVPEAFSHPAKFGRGLIIRIYEHAKKMGWVKPGDWVLDPFGGVALGALNAMGMGLNWVGIEIEEKFVKLGEQNIELWRQRLKGWPYLGTARIVQGDSRNLRDVIERVDIVISSPPYANEMRPGQECGIDWTKCKRENGSPRDFTKEPGFDMRKKVMKQNYGQSPGQLGSMKEGSFDICISSPPYADSINQGKDDDLARKRKAERLAKGEFKTKRPDIFTSQKNIGARAMFDSTYGSFPGQLGSMKEGSIDAVISSPPYEGCQYSGIDSNPERMMKGPCAKTSHGGGKVIYERQASKGNLGSNIGDTFWSASREIVQQCFDLLKPSGHCIWVTKNYIKRGKIVPFSDRWLALCESVGFKLVCRHQAMLVKEHGKQKNIHGKEEVIQTERKSFFRRLAESKGSPRIDWEDILCLLKEGN